MSALSIIAIILAIILAIIFVILAYFTYKIVKTGDTNKIIMGYSDINAPYIYPTIVQNFITPNKIKEIMAESSDKLVDSKIIGGSEKSIRNSQQTFIKKDNPIVADIYQKASTLLGIPVSNAEDLQVVRYRPGQYYNEHHDACCDDNKYCHDFIEKGGQRIRTVLIYLNSEFEGGNTNFPTLGFKVKPNPGDALIFYPLDKNGSKCHPLALHAGLPVTNGEKWIATIWFRERPFNV